MDKDREAATGTASDAKPAKTPAFQADAFQSDAFDTGAPQLITHGGKPLAWGEYTLSWGRGHTNAGADKFRCEAGRLAVDGQPVGDPVRADTVPAKC